MDRRAAGRPNHAGGGSAAAPDPRHDLRRLLVGNTVSTFGNAVYLVTVILLLKELTESPFVLGLYQFLALIPGFLLAPLSGAMIDRLPRRAIVVVADAARGVVMIAAALLVAVPALRTPGLLLALSVAMGAGNAFFVPAAQALIPHLVAPDALQRANGSRAAFNQAGNLAGNAIGGVLYAVLGAPIVFALNGATFLVSAWQERGIATPAMLHAGGSLREPLARRINDGIRLALGRGVVRRVVLSQTWLFLLSPVVLLALPFIVIDELGLPPATVGLFFAVSLAGGIAVFLTAARVPVERLLQLPIPAASYGALATALALVALQTSAVTLGAVAILAGGASGAIYLYGVTWIQRRLGAAFHGRVFALTEAASSVVAPLAYVAAGAAMELLGSERHWVLFAAGALLAGLWALRLVTAASAEEAVDQSGQHLAERGVETD